MCVCVCVCVCVRALEVGAGFIRMLTNGFPGLFQDFKPHFYYLKKKIWVLT